MTVAGAAFARGLMVLAVPVLWLSCNDTPTRPTADRGVDLTTDLRPDLTPDLSPDLTPPPAVTLPRSAISVDELGLVINTSDPQSVAVGAYYQKKRKIPERNVVRLSFSSSAAVISRAVFDPLWVKLNTQLGPRVQALALTWMLPYRVGCMSITSAFALGYDAKYCNDRAASGMSCGPTAAVSYFKSASTRPFTDHQLRPTMALAGVSEAQVKALIDRGLAAEQTFPLKTGYMVRTTDVARSARWSAFVATLGQWNHGGALSLSYIDNHKGQAANNEITNKTDVLFYFTGLKTLSKIASNTFRPGAVADHLTSFGGQLKKAGSGGQTSVLRWLEAGATGSYGAVVEPCNYPYKFPDTRYFLPFYFMGNTLVEAYWKSVWWPGEGIFVGDPLARPWGSSVTHTAGKLTIRTSTLWPSRRYTLYGSDGAGGKRVVVQDNITLARYGIKTIEVSPLTWRAYSLEPQRP